MWLQARIALLLLTLLAVGRLTHAAERDWWQNGNFYQIYPRSFKDSNGDGIGDLNGIAEQLPYLSDLGMDGVWLSPIFQSPMVDFGYDISDYYQIQPEYGTVDDLLDLIRTAHSLGLRLILDFVPNHTSDKHTWFQRSVEGDPKYRDFYVWHDGVVNASTGERQPPSNWVSIFRNSAWQWNAQRQQFYLHQFTPQQPDLNYRNPAVNQATKDVMNYWLQRGVDGFRIDAVPFIYEVDVDPATGTYPDEPLAANVGECPDPNDYCHLEHLYTHSHPEDIEQVYQWRDVVDNWQREHGGATKIILTEAYTSFENLMLMYGNGVRNGSNVPFNFELFGEITNTSTAADYKHYVEHWLQNMPSGVYANWVMGNHDNPRTATRLGPQRIDLINILVQTLPGIAVTYYGEELGMENIPVSWEDTVDSSGRNAGPDSYQLFSRDPERTPFPWNNSTNAGFSSAQRTWLPVGDEYRRINVAEQLSAENSHLKIFKRLTSIRKEEPAFANGDFEAKVHENVLLYKRQSDTGDAFLVVLNIGSQDVTLNLRNIYDAVGKQVEVAISSLQSGLQDGQKVNSEDFVALGFLGYVLRLYSEK